MSCAEIIELKLNSFTFLAANAGQNVYHFIIHNFIIFLNVALNLRQPLRSAEKLGRVFFLDLVGTLLEFHDCHLLSPLEESVDLVFSRHNRALCARSLLAKQLRQDVCTAICTLLGNFAVLFGNFQTIIPK